MITKLKSKNKDEVEGSKETTEELKAVSLKLASLVEKNNAMKSKRHAFEDQVK